MEQITSKDWVFKKVSFLFLRHLLVGYSLLFIRFRLWAYFFLVLFRIFSNMKKRPNMHNVDFRFLFHVQHEFSLGVRSCYVPCETLLSFGSACEEEVAID